LTKNFIILLVLLLVFPDGVRHKAQGTKRFLAGMNDLQLFKPVRTVLSTVVVGRNILFTYIFYLG